MENLEGEVWVDIIGYEGLYQISNKSRVRSLDRIVRSNGNTFRTQKGRIINKKIEKTGYLAVRIIVNNKEKRIPVHRLVAIHFIPNPNNLPIVEHIDDNKANDYIENLMWSTQSNNCLNKHYRSSKNQIKAVLQYDLSGNFIAKHESISNAQRLFNNNSSGIFDCLTKKNRINKTAYGFQWRYENEINVAGQPLLLIKEEPQLALGL